jgi:hypothetical protein
MFGRARVMEVITYRTFLDSGDDSVFRLSPFPILFLGQAILAKSRLLLPVGLILQVLRDVLDRWPLSSDHRYGSSNEPWDRASI